MNFDRINQQLQIIKTTKKIEDIHTLVGFLVELIGIDQCLPEELFMHASIQREFSRFVPAQGFHMQAGAYKIPHQSGLPLDIKLFWLKKTTKANMSWVMALTPNYEDNPETNSNLGIGIDVVVSENCDSVFIVLSNNLKVRVLELNGSLSLTQQEIFTNWTKIGKTTNRESESFKKEFHTLLWKSFDFEPINRKFYLQLVEQFDHLVSHLKKNIKEDEAKMFAVRLIGRTLFLWFLNKKEFINREFDYFTVSGSDDQTQYYRTKLEPLFFEVLNTEAKERTFSDKITPFLNGGLFEPIDTDFYKKPELTFPEGFFTQFFGVLNHYNFTVDEGTSEYEQVAVDPEMLGRVFENLLASLNDETGSQARKSKGAFYTPREIVDYMCEQSLIEYLKTKLPDTANRDRRIEELVTMDEATFREQDHNKRRDWKKDLGQEQVIHALDELRILDPAVGSGAFPMGMLNLLVKVYTRIDTGLEKDLAQLKRDILSRSLYGVDIDQMAIQISRLRAWLSILVDMESLKKVEPLPNLDFKFVCANTLIPLAGLDATNLFDETDLKNDLINIRNAYYAENKKSFKKKLRDHYLERIKDGGLFAELESERQRQLKDYNPFNPLNSSGFYDPTLMHGVEAFDVVIGNPPYVENKKIDQNLKLVYKNLYISAYKLYDLSLLFAEKGVSILGDNGILLFITTNKFAASDYGIKFRKFIENKLERILDLSNIKIFSTASAYTVILGLKKISNTTAVLDLSKEISDIKILNKKLNYLQNSNIFLTPNKIIVTEDVEIIKKVFEINTFVRDIREKYIYRPYGFTSWDKVVELKTSDNLSDPILIGTPSVISYSIDFKKEVNIAGKKYSNTRLKKDLNDLDIYHPNNLLIKEVAKELTTGYWDSSEICHITGVYSMVLKNPNTSLFYLGIFNSFLFKKIYKIFYGAIHLAGGYLKINSSYIDTLPIPLYVENQVTQKIVNLTKDITQKKKDNINADTSDLESQINELVMDLYGLNEEEKEVIRNS